MNSSNILDACMELNNGTRSIHTGKVLYWISHIDKRTASEQVMIWELFDREDKEYKELKNRVEKLYKLSDKELLDIFIRLHNYFLAEQYTEYREYR